ncbi:Transposase [compost metagenome]
MKEEFKIKVVSEVLAGVKTGVLARKYDIHAETIRRWVREYRDEVSKYNIPKPDEQLQELLRLQEVEEKYNKAKALLGEKELENEILRELLKKKNPAYLPNSR